MTDNKEFEVILYVNLEKDLRSKGADSHNSRIESSFRESNLHL